MFNLKRITIIIFIISIIFTNLLAKKNKPIAEIRGKRIYKYPFYIFSYKRHISYYVLSGYMGDVEDIKVLKIRENYSFKTSLKIIYKPTFKNNNLGWVGVFWQWPPNNWGNKEGGGYDLSKAKYFFFYAKGAKGGELIEFKIGGIKGTYGDSAEISTGIISLTDKWKLYKINLKGYNLKNIIAGFGFLIQAALNPEGCTFYLNDIYYSNKNKPEPPFFKDYLNLNKKKYKKREKSNN